MIEMNFTPYQSVGLFNFGASESEVELAVGKPVRKRRNSDEIEFHYENFTVTFSGSGVVEITAFPGIKFFINEADFFEQEEILDFLWSLDDNPLTHVGLVFFPKLGLSLGGIEDGADLAFTVISSGRFDQIINKFRKITDIQELKILVGGS